MSLLFFGAWMPVEAAAFHALAEITGFAWRRPLSGNVIGVTVELERRA
jgi:hypothetical protein